MAVLAFYAVLQPPYLAEQVINEGRIDNASPRVITRFAQVVKLQSATQAIGEHVFPALGFVRQVVHAANTGEHGRDGCSLC